MRNKRNLKIITSTVQTQHVEICVGTHRTSALPSKIKNSIANEIPNHECSFAGATNYEAGRGHLRIITIETEMRKAT